ncbi:MAG TPA: hypothetical protein VIY54_11485 [Steroidobacteraceae bacterium]
MTATRVALVTARAARGLDEDEPPLRLAMQAAGCEVLAVEWDDPAVQWDSFELALLRSAWDYAERLHEFLNWARQVSALTRVLNELPVVQWNTDKHYLAELAAGGVDIVPSTFIEPGEDPASALGQFLSRHPHDELVVKPAVGAGSRDTERHLRTQIPAAQAHVRRLLEARRSVLLQPYLKRVDEAGETALMFFDGHFSHAIRKGPLLPPAGRATTGLFAAETITARTPGSDELQLAEKALAAIPFATLAYARIDLLRDDAGAPRLLELELTEPSLFFAHAAGAAERFTAAVLQRCRRRPGQA